MAIPAVVNMAILVQELTFELYIKLFWFSGWTQNHMAGPHQPTRKYLLNKSTHFWGKMNIKIIVFRND